MANLPALPAPSAPADGQRPRPHRDRVREVPGEHLGYHQGGGGAGCGGAWGLTCIFIGGNNMITTCNKKIDLATKQTF